MADEAWLEKLRSIGGIVRGGTPKFYQRKREEILAQCGDKNSPMSEMVRDKVMYKQITQGNASDKSLKKDAAFLESNKLATSKREWKEKKAAKIKTMRKQYEKRWGYDPL